ncbi:MAG: CotH kinase family protein [Bacteroidales bacterium]|nr:CotH kinase family protein [Bacteroidales bacterium]MCF8458674.1 CotH kinase family protein [Bacteroidales bacterium]
MTKSILFTLAVVIGINLHAQDFYDLNTIQTIEITFAQSNWDQLLDAAYSSTGDYIMAQSISINGEVFDSVGVKYKGNSTYQANQTKNPFHIELDTYKDHIYEAYTDIKLSNVAKDPSFLREVLSYQILRQYMDAPLSNYANVYVNGTLIGLYSNSEAVSKKFVKDRFGSKNNTFVKCNPPDGAGPGSSDLPNLAYLGQDSSNYYDAYELKSDAGWNELIHLCDTLANNVTDIEDILDVDRVLWMLAFDNVLVNLDSYIGGFAQNYYLYRDDNKRFVPVVWDLNESFGQFAQTGSGNLNTTTQKKKMSHLLNLNDTDYPLVQKLLNVPMYKRMYLAHFKTILLENFDNNSYYTTAQSLQSLIDAAVQADGNKFFSYNNFISNLTTDITTGGGPGAGTTPGITNLMNGRNSYLLAQSDFTQTEPSIANIALSDTMPLINSTLVISASIANENAVYLGYRTEKNLPFERVQMYDDGAHNDGAANDGTYAVELSITDIFLQYYIYAENAAAGMFSPKRAEYEYHSITATYTTQSGDVVINEFMASNSATAADQDEEYDDWIELFNNGSSSIYLSGYYLSDDSSDLMKWTFPAGTSIAANGYLIIWADNDESQTGLHANFKLSASGETILLVNSAGVIVDQVSYLSQTTDVAYARLPNGTGSFQTNGPTFEANNELVNEIMMVVSEQPEIKLSPNPVSDSFTIEIESQNNPTEVLIYDLRGVLQFRETIYQQYTIDCSQWAKGMYVVRVGNSFVKLIVG